MAIELDLVDIQSGFLTATAFNENNQRIENALQHAIDRRGGANNVMLTDLDMGMNHIHSVKAAILQHQAVPLRQVMDIISASSDDITSLIDMEDRVYATPSQTVIELQSVRYTPLTNSLMVFKNGEYQRASLEYAETGEDSIEFFTPLSGGDVVDIFGSRYDAQQYVNLAIVAAENAANSEAAAQQYAESAEESADIAAQAAGYKLDINNQLGDTYVLEEDDAGDFIRMDNPLANTLVIPNNSSVAFEIGTVILVRQVGEGTTTIVPSLGVVANVPFNDYSISREDFGIALVKVDTNEWDIIKAFGGVDTSDLVAFTQEFDARLEELFKEILSASPTFVVNFDSLRSYLESVVTDLQQNFNDLEQSTTLSVDSILQGFSAISDDFGAIEQQFTNINSDFNTIQSDFTTIQNSFAGINSSFTTIQNEWTDVDQRMDSIEDTLDQLDLGEGFDRIFALDGYTKLPNGIIMQWGETHIHTGKPSNEYKVNFPISFPNMCFNVQVTYVTEPEYDGDSMWTVNRTRHNFGIRQVGYSANKAQWFAIGY